MGDTSMAKTTQDTMNDTLSSPSDGLLVICERQTLSEYIDLAALLGEGLKPEPTDDIEVPFPSQSYLKRDISENAYMIMKRDQENNSNQGIKYQDFNFFASGISGLTNRRLLPSVDNDTPERGTR